jgi:hypothetical protein
MHLIHGGLVLQHLMPLVTSKTQLFTLSDNTSSCPGILAKYNYPPFSNPWYSISKHVIIVCRLQLRATSFPLNRLNRCYNKYSHYLFILRDLYLHPLSLHFRSSHKDMVRGGVKRRRMGRNYVRERRRHGWKKWRKEYKD